MDSEALITFLATEYDTLLAEANIPATDTPEGLKPVLDNVSLALAGHDDLSIVWHRLLASYYALDRVVNRFATNMAVSISGDSYNLKQQFDHAKTLRDDAYGRVAWLVAPELPDDANGTGGPGTVYTLEMPYLVGGESSW